MRWATVSRRRRDQPMTRQIANGRADRSNGRPWKPTGQVAVRPRFAEKLQEVDREWRDHEPAIRNRLVENQLVVAPIQNRMAGSNVTVTLAFQGVALGATSLSPESQ